MEQIGVDELSAIGTGIGQRAVRRSADRNVRANLLQEPATVST